MIFRTLVAPIGLVLVASSPLLAADLVSIPREIAKQMKKGTKCELVWASPDFDASKGFRLGKVTDESDDEEGVVRGYLPTAFAKHLKADSPYVLNPWVVKVRMKTNANNGYSSAYVEIEGSLVEGAGRVVAAFKASSTETIGGNQRDNARIAVRTIVLAMSKDLFPASLPSSAKAPALIVAAPSAKAEDVIVEAPSKRDPKVAVPAGVPKVSEPPVPALIPDHVRSNMKPGKALAQVWIDPSYVKADGFSIGEVRYRVETRSDGVDRFLPDALKDMAVPGASSHLQLHIVELQTRSLTRGVSTAKLGVEGAILSKDGQILAAFTTRINITGTGDSTDDCVQASRRVLAAIRKDLM